MQPSRANHDPSWLFIFISLPIGSMYAIYGNIYHQYTPNVSIYTIHGSYGLGVHLILATTYGPRQVCLSQVGLPVGRVDVLVQVGALMIVKAAAARLGVGGMSTCTLERW